MQAVRESGELNTTDGEKRNLKKVEKTFKKYLTSREECGIITRSPRNDDKNHFETVSKKFEKLFKKVLTKRKRSDIIDKLTQKG